MPKTIDIPDVGLVEFPDAMSDKDIVGAIQNKILPKVRAEKFVLTDSPPKDLDFVSTDEPPAEVSKKTALIKEREALRKQPETGLAGEFLAAASEPFVAIPKPEANPDDPSYLKFSKGLIQSGIGMVESLESPLGVSALAVSALPVVGKPLSRVMGAGFGTASILDGFKEAAHAYQSGDMESAGRALGSLLIGSAIVRSSVAGLKGGPVTKATIKPEAVKEVSKVAPVTAKALTETVVDLQEGVLKPKTESVKVEPNVTAEQTTPIHQSPPKTPKWTSATSQESSGIGTEMYAGIPNPVTVAKSVVKLAKEVGPYLKRAADVAVDTAKEIGSETFGVSQMNDYRRSVLNWSAKLQKSFGESSQAQKDIRKSVPDPIRRDAITNWIQADGDASVLASRSASSSEPTIKAGYDAALALSPEEIQVAKDVQSAYDALGIRGRSFDVLKSFKDNYVTQIWDLGKGPASGSSRTLKEKFRFSKASTFPTFFDGEQAGYVPKTKDISQLLPIYLHEMNSVIAARQLVQEMGKGKASDGRPLLASKGGAEVIDQPAGGEVTLVMPDMVKEGRSKNPSLNERNDYKTLDNQPALHGWRIVEGYGTDSPVYLKADLMLHPEAYPRLKNVLGRSEIRQWYESKTGAMAGIPKAIVRGLDVAQSETKRTMLGLLAAFHQVQEGTHAVGHRVSPFSNIPKIDLVKDAGQMDAAKHGLMLLPDRVSGEQFMEGFRTSGLVSKIPVIGALSDFYSNYLFKEYIPGLKYKTYEAIFERNQKVYEGELKSGEVKLEDVKLLSSEQANAAYGHLNYADLARNPTIQHIAQVALLAPDFLEARARFAGQALKGVPGAKVGREQLLALATLGIAQATAAYTTAKLTGGEWDAEKPFEFHVGNRTYTMRSVPEDTSNLIQHSREFIYSRLNPLIGRGTVQFLSGVDWRGQKVTAGETAKELSQQPIPLSLRAILGTSKSSLSTWEQLAGTVGLRISRYSPEFDVREMVSEFKKSSKDPKLIVQVERAEKETLAPSDYKELRIALDNKDTDKAHEEYDKLLETKTPLVIWEAMNPNKPLTGSASVESRFVKTLDAGQKKVYNQAKAQRREIYNRFQEMKRSHVKSEKKEK